MAKIVLNGIMRTQIIIEVDTETGETLTKTGQSTIDFGEKKKVRTDEIFRSITESHCKTGSLLLGSEPVGKLIGNDRDIRLVWNGRDFGIVTTHKTVLGRIDGLSKEFREIGVCVGMQIHAKYDDKRHVLYVKSHLNKE